MPDLHGAIRGLTRTHTSNPNPGDAVYDSMGFHAVADHERWVFARITAGPSASGGTGAYSWVELVPLPEGTA